MLAVQRQEGAALLMMLTFLSMISIIVLGNAFDVIPYSRAISNYQYSMQTRQETLSVTNNLLIKQIPAEIEHVRRTLGHVNSGEPLSFTAYFAPYSNQGRYNTTIDIRLDCANNCFSTTGNSLTSGLQPMVLTIELDTVMQATDVKSIQKQTFLYYTAQDPQTSVVWSN